MSTIAARPPSQAPARLALFAILLVGAGLLGTVLALALRTNEIPGYLVLAGGIALLGMLALAVANYELAVSIAFLLSAVVVVEPAPPDAAFAVIMCVAAVTGRFRLSAAPLGAVLGVAAFIALNLISFFEVVDPARGARFMAITVYLLAFALWVPSWLTSTDKARRLLRIYIFIAVVSALVGTIALYVPFPGHEQFTFYTNTRARAFFKDPNVFGPFLVPAILLLMQEFLEPRLLKSGRFIKLILLGCLAMGILFSYSRAAWLNFAVGTVVMFVIFALRRGGARRALIFVFVVAVAIVAVIAAIEVTGSLSFLKERAQYQTYDNQRFGAQSGGIAIGERDPIGVGPGQFELVEPISAHSTYVRALAEEGILGFIVLTALLYGTLGMAVRNAFAGRDTFGLGSAALLASWCGILANSVFVDTLHWRHLWLVAGLIWTARQTSSSAGTRVVT